MRELDITRLLKTIEGFEWDKGNIEKNWKKHRVSQKESEQAFFNLSRIVIKAKRQSRTEKRYLLLGKTTNRRELSVIFTIRNKTIRVISARPMSRKERRIYAQAEKV